MFLIVNRVKCNVMFTSCPSDRENGTDNSKKRDKSESDGCLGADDTNQICTCGHTAKKQLVT